MKARSEKSIWALGYTAFLVSRFFKNEFIDEGFFIGAFFLFLGFWWFIIPFVHGREISLPSYANTVFIKGKDDALRWVFLLLGIFMFVVSLSVP